MAGEVVRLKGEDYSEIRLVAHGKCGRCQGGTLSAVYITKLNPG
ncbi:hypothetical protein AB691_1039 [Stutzerimonas stutzeri]|nr:hypothetical protein AB691_1039 [Stutzerimonas stutzeri]